MMICEVTNCDQEAWYRIWTGDKNVVCCEDCAEYLSSRDRETAIDRL